jgi:hypothetical protein
MSKSKIRSPAKFRKNYQMIVRNSPKFLGQELIFEDEHHYSTMKLLPKTNLPIGGIHLKIPVSDLLFGFRRPSYFMVYSLVQVDHETRKLYFDLKGLTTIPGWRLVSRLGRNDSHHNTCHNLLCYSLYGGLSRIHQVVKKTIRDTIQSELDELKPLSRVQMIKKILTGALSEQLKKKIESSDRVGLELIKEVLIFNYMPKD